MSPVGGRKPEAAGCRVTREDTSLVFLSIVCSVAYGLYGSCYSALAAAIPQLAVQLKVDSSDFGIAYTTRGVGYLAGTLLSAYVLKMPSLSLSKTIMSCFSLIFIAVTMFIIAFGTNYYAVLFVFLIQGLGFGGMDMMANCAVPELWGLRAQPWMQLMHTQFSIGSIIGPFFVGYLGFRIAFMIIAFSCLTPLGLLFLGTVAGANQHRLKQKHQRLSSNEENASGEGTSIEMTSLHGGSSAVLTLSDEDEIRFDDEEFGNKNSSSSSNNRDGSVRNPLSSGVGDADGTPSDGVDGSGTKEANHPTMPLPAVAKYLTCAFYFMYMGYSLGFSAWITVYALDVNVTDNEADAAYMTSVYWFAMMVGRIVAIFVAIYLSSTTMLRIKLVQCLFAGVLLIFISANSYNSLMAGTIVFGYADSSIFPLGMTVLTDYGFEMDESATTLFMVGTTMGEAILPAIFGFCMDSFGSLAFPWLVTACSIFLAAVYVSVDLYSKRAVKNHMLLDQSTHSVSGGGVDENSVHSKNSGEDSPKGVGGMTFSPLSGVEQEEDDLVQIEL